jgi:hypothetical protein
MQACVDDFLVEFVKRIEMVEVVDQLWEVLLLEVADGFGTQLLAGRKDGQVVPQLSVARPLVGESVVVCTRITAWRSIDKQIEEHPFDVTWKTK